MEKEIKKTSKKVESSDKSTSSKVGAFKKTVSEVKPKAKAIEKGFAVIETGGKQYRVSSGDTIVIEKLPGDYKTGDKIVFDKVLLIDDGKETKVGMPYLTGEKVEGVFEEEGKGKKVIVIKYKRKVRYRRKYGHRQPFTKVTIK